MKKTQRIHIDPLETTNACELKTVSSACRNTPLIPGQIKFVSSTCCSLIRLCLFLVTRLVKHSAPHSVVFLRGGGEDGGNRPSGRRPKGRRGQRSCGPGRSLWRKRLRLRLLFKVKVRRSRVARNKQPRRDRNHSHRGGKKYPKTTLKGQM